MPNHYGVVYTKRWVVDLILDVAGYRGPEILEARLCEPSCGEGSFLKAIAERLAGESQSVGCFDVETLSPRVVAYDLDERSVAVSKTAVADTLEAEGMERTDAESVAESWVRCGDYLLSDIELCDFTVGNPPYLRATEIDADARRQYVMVCETMTRGCDLFVAFIEKGLRNLKDGGSLTYICADRWLQNQYGRTLRGWLARNRYTIDVLIRMHGVDAFESEVDAYPAITRIGKGAGRTRYVDCAESLNEKDAPELKAAILSDSWPVDGKLFESGTLPGIKDDRMLPLASPARIALVDRLTRELPSLEETGVSLGIGIATGRDSVFLVDDPDIVEPERMLPAFSMRDYRRRTGKQRWLVNPWDENNELVDLNDWPRTKVYFEKHRDDLSRRHVAKKSGTYYRTIDKPNWSIYGREMLLWPDLATHADPVWSDGTRYPCHNCYWMMSDTWDLKSLAGLLMSDVAEAFVDALGVKMRGRTLRFQAQYLRLIHVPYPKDIPSRIMELLAEAFEASDRDAANEAARKAYQLGE